ncbi:hemicentin-1-like [Saccostrea echinata]|uniref:hemicentin-1-like n=1 Tax=Saccostrea echinata TaxID=191078 RepID=UPI002A7F36C5|nr:hemicentin-1-like [Saccostrea echinata]
MVRLSCIIRLILTMSFNIDLKIASCGLQSCVDCFIGKKLSITQIKILPDIGLETCFNKCQAHADCLSANYNRYEFVCQLISRKKSYNEKLIDDLDFIHVELPNIAHQSEKLCGVIACNNYSSCLRTSSGKDVCIATDCSEPLPTLRNGVVSSRTDSPISATYGCILGYTGVGSKNTIYCPPGGKWTSLSYRCEYPVQGGWGPWESWSSCSKDCDSGEKTRKRNCNNPYPMYGGADCFGSSTNKSSCNTNPCYGGGWFGRRKK